MVVLDEPNANLDMAGEAALVTTLLQLQRDGCTVVVVTHRTNVLQVVHKIALIVQGKLARYGSREEVLAAMAQPQSRWLRQDRQDWDTHDTCMPGVPGLDIVKK